MPLAELKRLSASENLFTYALSGCFLLGIPLYKPEVFVGSVPLEGPVFGAVQELTIGFNVCDAPEQSLDLGGSVCHVRH